MVEIPAATVVRARVMVDHQAAAREEAGDLLVPYHQGAIAQSHFQTELGDVLLGRAQGRTGRDEITLFKSVGVAIQDLCAAARALENARRLGVGKVLGD
jgi:ornithine cyclodeaminase